MDSTANTDQHYSQHLAKVNESNAVLASEDIINSQGALIVAKGANITPAAAKQIAQHKLAKSLDESVSLERLFSPAQMYECMVDDLETVGFKSLISDFKLEKIIKVYLEYACKQPMIRLKLSVLAETFEQVFNSTLISAALSLAICKEMRTDSEQAKNVFLAALLADTGLLHIDPKVARKKGQYSPEEWALYQGHVAISKSFADIIPKLNEQVGRAIMEHHERSDGFGYPFSKSGDDLCIEGRILAKVDTIMGVYRKRILKEGYAFSVIIPVLQFSSANNNQDVNNAAMRLLYGVSSTMDQTPSKRPVLETIPELIHLMHRINHWVKQIDLLLAHHKQDLAKPAAQGHVQMYTKLKHGLDSSGLLSEHQNEWLKEVFGTKNKDEYHVVEQFAVMLYEIEYQCQQAQRYFEPLIPELFEDTQVRARIQKASQKLSQVLQKEISP